MKNKYSLSDLKVGMEVYLSEISSIIGTTIVIDARTVDYSTGDPKGKIICIGNNYPKGVEPKDMILVNNCADEDMYLN